MSQAKPRKIPTRNVFPHLFVSRDIHWQFLNGKLEFSLNGNQPGDQWFSTTFEEDRWYHLAVVYSMATKSVQLYIDGQADEIKRYQTANEYAPRGVQFHLDGGPTRLRPLTRTYAPWGVRVDTRAKPRNHEKDQPEMFI